ncbi:alpha/beta hydrolase [Marimonas sp. MJW-29]|uniref:Alpha/beta hydrolase n=1 Tax=Sulfitobacter sediminis TaxID=3234186 RepID=A0ABV3RIV5_9RHOB
MKAVLWFVLAFALIVGALFLLGPYEDSDLSASFDASALEGGVARHFAMREAGFGDITPGVEKQVLWAGEPEAKTDWSILYLHGFSATAQEIRPVPDRVAEGLGANLVFTRLAGHGRGGQALAEATVADWMADVAEGLAAARAVGERVLILSTSTGGTLAAAAAVDAELSRDVAGIVLISPNFGIQNPLAPLLTFPAARSWLPTLAGAERSFEPRNEGQGQYWTTRYPSVAVLPMAALVKEVAALDLGQTEIPALFIFSPDDTVVRPDLTEATAARWGGPVSILNPDLGPGDDPDAHVIAGDIMSPGQTEATVQAILDWAEGL